MSKEVLFNRPKITPEERRAALLTNPAIYVKVQEGAAIINRQLAPTTDILMDLPVGAKFKDVETGKTYSFDGVATPYKHNDIVSLIAETAKQPLEDMPDMTYFIVREDFFASRSQLVLTDDPETQTNSMYGQNLVISGRDFIKYFAVGKWVMITKLTRVDPDEFSGTKNVLKNDQ